MTSSRVLVSVVVPFRNGEPYLRELLESLVLQTLDEPWELVVVDNGSTDRSREVVTQYASRLPLRIIEATARANPSYARNVGARASVGRKLVFIDADDTVNTEYLSAMARALEEHHLVTSRVDSVTLNAEWVRAAQGPPWQADGIGVFYDFLPASGVNIGVTRELFDSLDGFPEDFAACEDIAFCWNARLNGHADLWFVPEAVYRYRYRDTLPNLFRQSARWGRASVLLFRHFHPLGMPARPVKVSVHEWRTVVSALLRARTPAARAPLAVRLGACVGRLQGSVRYRVWFF